MAATSKKPDISTASVGFSTALLSSLLDKSKDQGFLTKMWSKVSGWFSKSEDLVTIPENTFLSPMSIFVALGMASAGSALDTARIIDDVLFKGMPMEEVHAALESVLKAVTDKNAQYKLLMANRLYSKSGFEIIPEFNEALKKHYGSEICQRDFEKKADEVRKEINDWVLKETESKIQNLVGPNVLKPITRLFLVNAVYFKGAWKDKFEDKNTKDDVFYTAPTHQKNVPFMYQKGEFPYGDNEEVQVLAMPYAGEDMSLYVFLPREKYGVMEVVRNLTGAKLLEWTKRTSKSTVKVKVPKFKMESSFHLQKALTQIGLGILFDQSRADFSGITKAQGERLNLSDVLHKAHIEVNEEGSEAAAATGLVMVNTSLAGVGEEVLEFNADHPFLYAIWHHTYQFPVFLGALSDPTK